MNIYIYIYVYIYISTYYLFLYILSILYIYYILYIIYTGKALRYARAGQLQLFKNGRLLCFCTGCKHLIFTFVAHMFYLRPGGSVRISSVRYICYCPLDFICFCREVFHMFLPQQPIIL